MCATCGCHDHTPSPKSIELHTHNHTHDHHDMIQIEQDILSANNAFADLNRKYFQEKNMLVLNVMSSPGSGKTTFLTKTIQDFKQSLSFQVIVGDQQTDRDARRIATTGVNAIQINTGKTCHLDAHDIHHALEKLKIPYQNDHEKASDQKSVLLIENVGNLVCPALFDLGETYRVVMLSVTEGDDKPLKYPHMFYSANLVLITKIDLLSFVDFDLSECSTYIKQINPHIDVILVSTKNDENLYLWKKWVTEKCLKENKSTSLDACKV